MRVRQGGVKDAGTGTAQKKKKKRQKRKEKKEKNPHTKYETGRVGTRAGENGMVTTQAHARKPQKKLKKISVNERRTKK